MTAFTHHPNVQGFTYFSHFAFAAGIAWRLLRSVIAFALHAIFPFVSIEPVFDLEATSAYLLERNRHVEGLEAVPQRKVGFQGAQSETPLVV